MKWTLEDSYTIEPRIHSFRFVHTSREKHQVSGQLWISMSTTSIVNRYSSPDGFVQSMKGKNETLWSKTSNTKVPTGQCILIKQNPRVPRWLMRDEPPGGSKMEASFQRSSNTGIFPSPSLLGRSQGYP